MEDDKKQDGLSVDLNQNSQTESINNPVDSKKSKKLSKVIFLTLAGLFLLGGSAAGYFGYIVPNRPENVLATAVDNLSAEETKLENGKFNIFFETWPRKDSNPSVTINGVFADSNFEADANISMVGQTPLISLKKIGEDLYLKIDNIKNTDELSQSYTNLAESESPEEVIASIVDSIGDTVIGIWFKIPQSSAENLANISGASAPINNLTQNGTQGIFNDLIASGAFSLEEFVGKEDVGGAQSNHYKIKVGKGGLKTFISIYANKLDIGTAQNTQLQEAVDKINDEILTFDLWVHSSLKIINKIYIDTSKVTGDNYLKFGFEISGINEGYVITPPEDAKSFEELAGQLLFNNALQDLY